MSNVIELSKLGLNKYSFDFNLKHGNHIARFEDREIEKFISGSSETNPKKLKHLLVDCGIYVDEERIEAIQNKLKGA